MTMLLPNPRYERKFLAYGLSLAEVWAAVRRHPAMFREVYPARAVNNIYLDSSGLRDYFSHVSGAGNRVKTRIRWYGPLNGHIEKPALERKIKRGLVGGKVAHPLPALVLNGSVARRVLDSALDRAEMLRLALRAVHPCLLNRYQRQYWLSADGRFRLTVDSSLEFFGVRGGAVAATASRPRNAAVIIELKFDPRHAEVAGFVTNALPFRLARCSKYVLGVECLGVVQCSPAQDAFRAHEDDD
jgi:hypothetical protein